MFQSKRTMFLFKVNNELKKWKFCYCTRWEGNLEILSFELSLFFRQRKSLTLRKEDWCSSRGSRLWSIMKGRRNKWNYRRKCKKNIFDIVYNNFYILLFINWISCIEIEKKNILVYLPFKFFGVNCGTTFFM